MARISVIGLSIHKTSRQHNKTLRQVANIMHRKTTYNTSENTKVNGEVISHGRTVMFSWFLMVLNVRWSD